MYLPSVRCCRVCVCTVWRSRACCAAGTDDADLDASILAARLAAAQAQIDELRLQTLDRLALLGASGAGSSRMLAAEPSGVTLAAVGGGSAHGGMPQPGMPTPLMPTDAGAVAAAAAAAWLAQSRADLSTLAATTAQAARRRVSRRVRGRVRGRRLKGGGGGGANGDDDDDDDSDGGFDLDDSPFCNPRDPDSCQEYGGSCEYFIERTAEV